MQNMTPQQAIEILDRAVAQISTTRADHFALQQAIQVLTAATKVEDEVSKK